MNKNYKKFSELPKPLPRNIKNVWNYFINSDSPGRFLQSIGKTEYFIYIMSVSKNRVEVSISTSHTDRNEDFYTIVFFAYTKDIK